MLAVMSNTVQGLAVKERTINGNKNVMGFVGKRSKYSPNTSLTTAQRVKPWTGSYRAPIKLREVVRV